MANESYKIEKEKKKIEEMITINIYYTLITNLVLWGNEWKEQYWSEIVA